MYLIKINAINIMLLNNMRDKWDPINTQSINPVEDIYIGSTIQKCLYCFEAIYP